MFDIETFQDFYGMLIEDFDEFTREPSSARRALHCAITAYHLHEWVWKDWLVNDTVACGVIGITDFPSFKNWIDRTFVWFPTIRSLTNGTKHFKPGKDFETRRIGGYGQGPYGVGPYGHSYLVIDYGEEAAEHRWQPAGHLLEATVRFWRDFFRKFRPNLGVPDSPHHVD